MRGEILNFVEEEKKRIEFSQVLKDLAMAQNPSQYDKAQFFKRLEALYHTPGEGKDFRHFYSDILTVLIEIKENDPKSGSLEYLILNLDGLRHGYIPNKNLDSTGGPIDIQDYIRKLYDHVNLEVQRIRYSDYEDYKISKDQAINNLENKVNRAELAIRTAERRIVATERRIVATEKNTENAKREYVAILGIFAAIVIAFTGGLVFSSSVLEYMHKVSIYRILIVILLIGLVLFNVIYLLVWYINKIVRDEHGMNWDMWTIVHLVIAILMFTVFMFWVTGTVEHRNERIFQSDTESSIVETESSGNSSYIKNQDETT